MLTHDDALARARAWFGLRPYPEGLRSEVRINEFEGGWFAVLAEVRDDPARRPSLVGGPQLVIDRETGQIYPFGSQSPATIAERYTSVGGDGRFPLDVARVLHFKGWQPGRDVSGDVDAWLARNAGRLDGRTPSPAARAALDEFGGLWVQRFDADGVLGAGSSSFFHPGRNDRPPSGITGTVALELFPIGWVEDDDGAELAMDARGRVFALHGAGSSLVGDNLDAAIVNLVRSVPWPPAEL